ncbi:MAG: META domain-containing protein [Campylobacteraceae bacterium]|jgi:heat shock protein HslJ|nr:META domain-containing protein [Campylobacteraceae bacterium]
MIKAIFTAIFGLFFIGCALQANNSSADIFINTSWTLVSISGKSPDTEKPPALRFSDKKASGFSGVNNFSANYKISNDKIVFSEMISTRMASLSAELSKLETDFISALLDITSFELNGDTLSVYGANHTLVFQKTR